MSLYTLSFLCALAIFALQVPGNSAAGGKKYIYIKGFGKVYLTGNTKVQKSNGRTVITRTITSGSKPGNFNPLDFFKLVNPNNRPNPNKPSANSGPGSSGGSGGSSRGSGGSPSNSGSVKPSEIVNEHNKLRSGVDPPARNMMKMRWNKELAANAQKWADRCTLTHTKDRRLGNKRFGENLYMSSYQPSWKGVIRKWHSENKFWKYGVGPTQSKKEVGHFTQVVWADSNEIGCGMAICPKAKYKYYYVCQYSPPGNSKVGYKQFPYKKGPSCSDCRGSCQNNLCTRR